MSPDGIHISVDLLRQYVRKVIEESRLKKFDMEEFRRAPDPEEYLDNHAKFINSGIERRVYDTGLGYVIKFSYTSFLAQNEREANIGACSAASRARGAPRIVPAVYVHAPDYSWIAVEKVRPLQRRFDVNRFLAKETGGLIDSVKKLYQFLDGYDDISDEQVQATPWLTALLELHADCKIVTQEMHYGNWGVNSNGTLVLLDAGM